MAARDVYSPTADRLLALTPLPQTGPSYSDLSRIAMERARTAREAVEILGRLIDQYGYSDYGGNSHLFADKDEGWVFIDYGGGQRLWAAERLGPKDVRALGPGYLDPFPLDYEQRPNEYRASKNFVDYAVQKGWFDPRGADAVLERSRRRFGVRMPTGQELPGETMRPESQDLARRVGAPGRGGSIVTCHRPGIDRYPREHGSYRRFAGRLLDGNQRARRR